MAIEGITNDWEGGARGILHLCTCNVHDCMGDLVRVKQEALLLKISLPVHRVEGGSMYIL